MEPSGIQKQTLNPNSLGVIPITQTTMSPRSRTILLMICPSPPLCANPGVVEGIAHFGNSLLGLFMDLGHLAYNEALTIRGAVITFTPRGRDLIRVKPLPSPNAPGLLACRT
jgi:hypothetical protein